MAYEQITFDCGQSVDYEIRFKGNYGAKGEKRAPRRKATPEQMAKQNQWKKETHMHRLLRNNFNTEDHLFTLKWRKGARPSLDEVLKTWKNFADSMRNAYKKYKLPWKWVHRIELGKHGGRHIHIIMNHIDGVDMTALVQSKWKAGHINCTPLYEEGNFKDLAEYMTKLPTEEIEGQLSLFETEEQKAFRKYSHSRNLKEPEVKKKPYKRRTLRKILACGPEQRKGWYIDKASIVMGVNPYTGYSYIHYTEYRIRHGDRRRHDETG